MIREKFYGHDWLAEFLVRDLEEYAEGLRRIADGIDMKAALLHSQMTLASAIEAQRAETENTGSVEDESAAPQEDAQPQSTQSGITND